MYIYTDIFLPAGFLMGLIFFSEKTQSVRGTRSSLARTAPSLARTAPSLVVKVKVKVKSESEKSEVITFWSFIFPETYI